MRNGPQQDGFEWLLRFLRHFNLNFAGAFDYWIPIRKKEGKT
jgi:hypothetical protein